MKNRYAQTWFVVDDVRELRPDMTIREAGEWLESNEMALREELSRVGYAFLNKMLQKGK